MNDGFHPCFCPRCRKTTSEVVAPPVWLLTSPIGEYEAYADTSNKRSVLHSLAKKDKTSPLAIRERLLSLGESVPGKALCRECQAVADAIRRVVLDGGVAVTCKECGMVGAIRPDSPLARQVREAALKTGTSSVYNDPRVTLTLNRCVEHEDLQEGVVDLDVVRR